MKYLRFCLLMLVLLSVCIGALAAGDGSENNPYQIGDTVIADQQPTGATVANSRWVSQQVAASRKLVCTVENHTHDDDCYTQVAAHTLWTLTALPDPASLTLRTVDAGENTPLAGAKFGIYTDAALTAGSNVTKNHVGSGGAVTGTDGKLTLSGFTTGTYYLVQETAVQHYGLPDTVWKLTAAEADGLIGLTITIHDSQLQPKLENGVLVVSNTRQTGTLVITGAVEYYTVGGEKLTQPPISDYLAENYSFDLELELTGGDWTQTQQGQTVEPGKSKSYADIPYGASYEIKAAVPENALYSLVSSTSYKGTISAAEQKVNLTIRYYYDEKLDKLSFYTVDSTGSKKLSGAIYTLSQDKAGQQVLGNFISDKDGLTTVTLPTDKSGTYYLRQTKAPSGYHGNSTVYTLQCTVASAPVKDAAGKQVITTTLTLKEDLPKSGSDLAISNQAITYRDITVKVAWNGDSSATRPSSVQVTLYRDGSSYKTETLNAAGNWTCSWKDLSDEHSWEVKQTQPNGYTTKLTQQNNTYTFTNSLDSNPATGDNALLLLWASLALLAVVGIVVAAIKLRKL